MRRQCYVHFRKDFIHDMVFITGNPLVLAKSLLRQTLKDIYICVYIYICRYFISNQYSLTHCFILIQHVIIVAPPLYRESVG